MQTSVLSLDGSKLRTMRLPTVFDAAYRPDLIHKVFWSVFTHRLQPKGTDPFAGERTSAESRGVGLGMARLARVKAARGPRAGFAAGVAGVVKGRVAHPPRKEKRIYKHVNRKERRLATASAIAATGKKELASSRGHRVAGLEKLPIVVSKEIEKVSRAQELRKLLLDLGLADEILRVESSRKHLSGTSRRRGRVTKTPRGPLLAVASAKVLKRAAESLPGVGCVEAKNISILDLAPGGQAGRLVIWSENTFKSLPKSILAIGESLEA